MEGAERKDTHVIYTRGYKKLRKELRSMARDDPYLDKRIRSEIGDVIFRLDAAEARRKHVEEHRDPIAARLEYRREELGLEAPTGMFWKMSERWGGTGGGDGIAAHRAAPRFLVTVPPLLYDGCKFGYSPPVRRGQGRRSAGGIENAASCLTLRGGSARAPAAE